MERKIEVTTLMARIAEAAAGQDQAGDPLGSRQESQITPYRQAGDWPGCDFVLIGNSYNADSRLVGLEMEARRAGCLSLMFENLGGRNHCVTLADAMAFEGFTAILSRFERDWLEKLPGDTVIGPAYETGGRRIRTSFAVWRYEGSPQPERQILASSQADSRLKSG